MRALLDAGLRIDGFPGIICWSRARPPVRPLPADLARAWSEAGMPVRHAVRRVLGRSRHRVLASRRRGSPDRALGRSLTPGPPSQRPTGSRPRATPRHRATLTVAPSPTPSLRDRLTGRAAPRPDRPAGRRAPRRHHALPERQGGAQGRRARRPRGRLRVPRRAVGRGQVHADEAAHPRRAGDQGHGRRRRRRPRPPQPAPGPEGAPQDRDRVPGLQAAAAQVGLGERRVRARGHRDAAARRSGRRSTACSPSSG